MKKKIDRETEAIIIVVDDALLPLFESPDVSALGSSVGMNSVGWTVGLYVGS